MDMMEMRFRMMSMMGGSGMVGNLSKYEKIKVTPSSSAELTGTFHLGVIPKIVIVDSDQTYVATQFLKRGIFGVDFGAMSFINGADSEGAYGYTIKYNEIGTTNQTAYFSDTTITIRRGASTRYFDTNTEYTIEIYA